MRTVPPPGAHGGDGETVAFALGIDPSTVLDLSASLNPFAPDPSPVVARAIAAGALGRYPSAREEIAATTAMADAIGVDPARVLLTNGGAEAIALVATELGRGWVEEPEFSLYRRHIPLLDPTGPLFRSDPGNPSGLLAGDEDEAAVWDEAFYPLATGRWSRTGRGGEAPRDRPALSIGSVTKVMRCPGLRIGFVVTPPDDGSALGEQDLHARLSARRPQWSVGTPGLVALPELLAQAEIEEWARAIGKARDELRAVLAAHGLRARESDAPFLLVDEAGDVRTRLARKGVVVRDCGGFGMPGTVRVAVPDADGLERLDRAL